LNFFLFKRDKQFYDKVVKVLVQNKLEKTFMDQYLLGIELEDAENDHAQHVLSYIELSSRLEELNALEQCLLIDFCLSKGSELQKAKARRYSGLLRLA